MKYQSIIFSTELTKENLIRKASFAKQMKKIVRTRIMSKDIFLFLFWSSLITIINAIRQFDNARLLQKIVNHFHSAFKTQILKSTFAELKRSKLFPICTTLSSVTSYNPTSIYVISIPKCSLTCLKTVFSI